MAEPALFSQVLAAAGVSDAKASFVSLSPALARAPSDDVRALVLAAHMGRLLGATEGAFWFPQRESRFQWALGFPRALLVVDPAPLVERLDLPSIDARVAEIQASLSSHSAAEGALDATRYAALFDPDMLQPLVLDRAKVEATLSAPTNALVDWVRQGLAALDVNPMEREALQDLVIGSRREREHIVALLCAVKHGAAAEEGFWADVVLRLPGVKREPGARLLGVFRMDAVEPIVDVNPPRLLAVDARDLVVTSSGEGPRGDGIDLARARLEELDGFASMATGSLVLAFHRLTASELAHADALGQLARSL